MGCYTAQDNLAMNSHFQSISKRSVVCAVLISLIGTLILTSIVLAHSRYVRSTPGDGAIIATAPTRVDIWFSQELFRRKGENVITVTGPDGTEVSVGDTSIDDDDRTHIWVKVKSDVPAGVYQVAWKNVSLEDGHDFAGSFSFTIDPKALATSTPMGTPTEIGAPTPIGQAVQPTAEATPTVEPAIAEVNPTPVTTLAAAPTKSAPASGPCGLGTAPVIGLAGYVIVKRSRRKRTA